MRRMCFDIESNYYHTHRGIGEPEAYRDELRSRHPSFRCGVIYDEVTNSHCEFKEDELPDFVIRLMEADELISQNGRRHDLPILEVASKGAAVALRRKPHWDLCDLGYFQDLDSLREIYAPKQAAKIAVAYKKRRQQIDSLYPQTRPGMWPEEHRKAHWLAKASFDVRMTYAVWLALCARYPDKQPTCREEG